MREGALAGGGGLMSVFGMALLVPMLAFYWLLDWERLGRQWSRLVPPRWRAPGRAVMAECDELFGQYLRGQLLVMGVLAVYYSVGLSAFGFSLALPIGVFTGLAVCIPYLGFGLGMILALLAGLLQFGAGEQGVWWPLVAVAVVYGLGQVVESFFLTPRLVGERIGLHPLGVIFALMLFGQWMGFWGLLIALPVSAGLLGAQLWLFLWAPLPEKFKEMGSLEFAKKLMAEALVAVSPGIGFGEYGEGYVRIGLVENEHRIKQAARNVKKFIANADQILAKAHNSLEQA